MTEYTIGEQIYTQDSLVLGQFKHLQRRLRKVGAFSANATDIMRIIGEHLEILLCILIPKGTTRKDWLKVLDENGQEFREALATLEAELSPQLLMQVVKDFFVCNPISSLSNEFGNLIQHLNTVATPTLTPSMMNNGKPIMPSLPEAGLATATTSEKISP